MVQLLCQGDKSARLENKSKCLVVQGTESQWAPQCVGFGGDVTVRFSGRDLGASVGTKPLLSADADFLPDNKLDKV